MCFFDYFGVTEKPVIVARPQDTTVSEHSVVRLRCRATGDPEPVIVWTKRDGQIPAERSEKLLARVVLDIVTIVITLHWSYFKYRTAKPLLYAVYRAKPKTVGNEMIGKRDKF